MKVILDTDPGIDDALAFILLKAMPEISLQAITVTHGNTSVEKCTTNALKLVELLGMQDIPVAMGATEPLVRALSIAEETHGDTGLGHAILPEPKTQVIQENAANLIIDIVNANPGEITILCIGPVTNLALALLKEPTLRKKIKNVVSMAGTIHYPGNATPSSEYNVFCDPESFDILLRSGIDLTIIPLDVTYQCLFTKAHVARLDSAREDIRTFIDRSTAFYMEFHAEYQGIQGCAINDPLAAAILVKPDLVTFRNYYVDIELHGEFTKAHVARLDDAREDIRTFIDRSTAFYMEFHAEYQGIQGCAINDPLAAAILVKPDLVTFRDYYVDIELHGEFTTAKISADHFNATGKAPNAKVAMEVNIDAFMDFFIERVSTI